MTILSRQVDEWIVIGEKLMLAPTDIDPAGVRVRVRGELMGGADDGLVVDRPHELAIGSSIGLGTLINLTLMKIEEPGQPQLPRAVFGIQAPPNVTIHRKELADPKNRTRGDKADPEQSSSGGDA
jgi:sRNA-binding carbon storage regulator CsrA